MKDQADFLPADNCQIFPQIDTFILGMWPGMPKIPNILSLLFLCNILRNKCVIKLIFWMETSMKACYKLIYYFNWDSQASPEFPK